MQCYDDGYFTEAVALTFEARVKWKTLKLIGILHEYHNFVKTYWRLDHSDTIGKPSDKFSVKARVSKLSHEKNDDAFLNFIWKCQL